MFLYGCVHKFIYPGRVELEWYLRRNLNSKSDFNEHVGSSHNHFTCMITFNFDLSYKLNELEICDVIALNNKWENAVKKKFNRKVHTMLWICFRTAVDKLFRMGKLLYGKQENRKRCFRKNKVILRNNLLNSNCSNLTHNDYVHRKIFTIITINAIDLYVISTKFSIRVIFTIWHNSTSPWARFRWANQSIEDNEEEEHKTNLRTE